jgi:hypothetical protein
MENNTVEQISYGAIDVTFFKSTFSPYSPVFYQILSNQDISEKLFSLNASVISLIFNNIV